MRRLLRAVRLPLASPVLDVDPGPAERYLLALYEELSGPFVADETIAHNHLENWLREVARAPQRIRAGPPEALTRLRTYLELHYADTIRLAEPPSGFRCRPSTCAAFSNGTSG